MPGPCSQPAGDKTRWEELNEIICNVHFHCNMDPEKDHDLMTYRMWLSLRNRLRTGKTR